MIYFFAGVIQTIDGGGNLLECKLQINEYEKK